MWSSKFSTPRLSRVTPRSRIALSLWSVSVPGSHRSEERRVGKEWRSTRWPRDWSSDVCSSDLGNKINVDLRKAHFTRIRIGAGDFFAVMRPAVEFQDVVVEVFHAQAQPRHSQVADRLKFMVGERSRFA